MGTAKVVHSSGSTVRTIRTTITTSSLVAPVLRCTLQYFRTVGTQPTPNQLHLVCSPAETTHKAWLYARHLRAVRYRTAVYHWYMQDPGAARHAIAFRDLFYEAQHDVEGSRRIDVVTTARWRGGRGISTSHSLRSREPEVHAPAPDLNCRSS